MAKVKKDRLNQIKAHYENLRGIETVTELNEFYGDLISVIEELSEYRAIGPVKKLQGLTKTAPEKAAAAPKKKAPAKKASAKKAPAKKTPAKKAPAKKAPAEKLTARKATPKK
jgi:hypothetical protein